MMPFFSVALAAEFVLLAPQGTLHLTPDGPSSAPWAMEPLPMELLAEDGEWLQVRSTRGHCYEDIGAGNAVTATEVRDIMEAQMPSIIRNSLTRGARGVI